MSPDSSGVCTRSKPWPRWPPEAATGPLGWTEGGALTPGSLADFATLGLDSVRLAGADAGNALASAIFAASNADVRHLVVDGAPVVVDGTHVSIDVASELDSVIPELMTS